MHLEAYTHPTSIFFSTVLCFSFVDGKNQLSLHLILMDLLAGVKKINKTENDECVPEKCIDLTFLLHY